MFEACTTLAITLAFCFWPETGQLNNIIKMMLLLLTLWGSFETAAALGFITPA